MGTTSTPSSIAKEVWGKMPGVMKKSKKMNGGMTKKKGPLKRKKKVSAKMY